MASSSQTSPHTARLDQDKLTIFAPKIGDLRGTSGVVLLTFALFVMVNWENPYVQYITTGSFTGASSVFY